MLSHFPRRPIVLLLLACLSGSSLQIRGNGPREIIAIHVNEGTNLAFDLSPDGKSIVMDLLGQLWLLPAEGGRARPITNAVRDSAEDLDPSFSPDGQSIVFRGERNGRTGLWRLNLNSNKIQQLTQLSNPDGYDGDATWSPDGRVVAFTRAVPSVTSNSRPRISITLLDVASRTTHDVPIAGLANPFVSDPVWVRGGKEIAFVARRPQSTKGGRVWMVASDGGQARAVTTESVQAFAPSFSPDGRRMAYFAADSTGRIQVWMQEISNEGIAVGSPSRLTNHKDVTATRIRWTPKGDSLIYSADGRLWKIKASAGEPAEIRFNAGL